MVATDGADKRVDSFLQVAVAQEKKMNEHNLLKVFSLVTD